MNRLKKAVNRVAEVIRYGVRGSAYRKALHVDLQDKAFLEQAIRRWRDSPERLMQIKGELYYQGDHDILSRKRTMIGEEGKLQEVENLPNNRVIDNQYKKAVNQKANYLLGQPFSIDCKNTQYADILKTVFNKRFMRILKNAGKAAMNNGIAWLYPYYDKDGVFSFRIIHGYEILPFWADSEHTSLTGAVRLYSVTGYDGNIQVIVNKVEVFSGDGVRCFILDGDTLIPDPTAQEQDCAYVLADGKPLNWDRIPLIPIKYNEQELPLIKNVKSLQDGINIILSDFENNMQEDARNTILVLKNYDGQNLGEFRRNLATYGAVKVRYDGDTKGGVETLEITVNAENYKVILELFKKALIENAMSYDAKDDRLSGNPNQMNIQSMYSDIDLDANDMETELQAAFEEILWFVNMHLLNTGKGDFSGEEATIIFNRNIIMNESEAIENCAKSVGILSDETIVANHPWIDDPQAEMERLEKQKEKEKEEMMENQYDPFAQQGGQPERGADAEQ